MRKQQINKGWKFYRDAEGISSLSDAEYVAVDLPHTWNNLDGQDGGGDYYRGKCYYAKVIDLNKDDALDYYLEFEGANTIAYVYVNNELVGQHEGGFSRFRMCVTPFVTKGENTIVVAVDNSSTGRNYPDTADFTFFGGIYRDVYFIETSRSRFDLDYYGGDGVTVTPRMREDGSADIEIVSYLTGAVSGQTLSIDIEYEGKMVTSGTMDVTADRYVTNIPHPVLWQGVEGPHMYTAHVRLMDGDKMLDSRDIPFGIRTFKVDENGFYLNGVRYPLHGVSRHQDRLDKGWAISKADHEEDMSLIREVGANTIRLAHYQHASYFYDLCDRYGMVVWAEIPYISVHLEDGDEDAMNQMRELVIQNYNHPSIMFWGLSNEITIGGESEAQLELHKRLESVVKELDDTRLTTMAAVTMCNTRSPLLDIPDIIAYNHYFGWYVGSVEDNARWLDQFRADFPNRPIAISEYGAESILTWHSAVPKQGDYSEEYQCYYHENMLRIFEDRPYLWATYVWNMFDFAADSRDEGGVKGRNNKGLVTYDRKTRKDSFYLYKAYWSDEPFIHIAGKRYKNRAEKLTSVKIYTNQPTVDLYVNDELYETKNGIHVYEFMVPISLVGTRITAVSGSLRDSAKLRRVMSPEKEYILKKDRNSVHNWFEKDGVKYTFEYPRDAFSIRDTFDEIYATDEGKALLLGMMRSFVPKGSDVEKFVSNMRGLVGSMSIERIAAFAGEKIDEDLLYHVNVELNRIKKNDNTN